LCHRMKRSQARLILPTEEAAQVERLGTGRAVLWRTSGATSIITVPNTTAEDVRRVAGLLTDDAATMPKIGPTVRFQSGSNPASETTPIPIEMRPEWSQNGARMEPGSIALERGRTVSAEAARAAEMFMAGKDPAAIVGELRQVSSKASGSKYQKALAE